MKKEIHSFTIRGSISQRLFCLFVFVLSSMTLFGQIYVDLDRDSLILIGPDLVWPITAEIVEEHLDELEQSLDGNKIFLEEVIGELGVLSEKEKLKRKEERKFWRLEKDRKVVEEKIEVLLILQHNWLALEEELELKKILTSSLNNDGCMKIETDLGIFSKGEYVCRLSPIEEVIKYEEKIPVEFVKSKSAWEKKRSNNCQSAEPNDCLVWCLVETSSGFQYADILGNYYKNESCPTGFSYEGIGSNCIRKKETRTSEPIIEIFKKEGNQQMRLLKLLGDDCD